MRCDEKRWYVTKHDAKLAAGKLHKHGLPKGRVYRCPECRYWHLTTADADQRKVIRASVRAGVLDGDD